MKRRSGFLLLMALWAAVPGCAGTARRDDGSPIFGPRAWKEAEAPPQRAVMLTANRSDGPTDPAPRREGLARYFPGLVRNEPPKVAAMSPAPRYRPTWLGLRPAKATAPQTYMTDARGQWNRSVASPTSLPVALQVPSDRAASDRMVRPTNAETAVVAGAPSTESTVASSDLPDFGGKPSKPGEDDVNPLPPASEPTAVANRMPEVPPVDPMEGTSTGRRAPKPALDEAAPDMHAVRASTDSSETPPAEEPAKPATATATAPAPTQQAKPVAETSKVAAPSKGTPPTAKVYASPQGDPPKPKEHVHATSKVKPTPQAEETAKTWKRPCLRRLVRKVCKLGEYADPPTAAPH